MTDLSKYFEGITLAEPLKKRGMGNPLMTQRLGADPYVIWHEERLYVYMTGDVVEYDEDGKLLDNSYSKINTLNVISSADLVNWTDHGYILAAGEHGAAKWGGNSWAPAIVRKDNKFYIYFANSGNGIGVLSSDSPTGPFIDPLGKALITRGGTPNCMDVKWLFDPAVLVDNDGRAYIYFGGGVPDGMAANPGTGRMAELGADMISLASDPVVLEAPYLYEDAGINKINGVYYYSYCTNFDVDDAGREKFGIENGEIAYMTSTEPLGNYEFKGSICKNPEFYFGTGGNNHHCIFELKGKYYIAYHAFLLQDRLGLKGCYRATHIDYLNVDDKGVIHPSVYTEKGVEPIANLNPYTDTSAVTIGTMAGLVPQYTAQGEMSLSGIKTGSWLTVYGADFGNVSPKKFIACVKPPQTGFGVIQVNAGEKAAAYLEIKADDSGKFIELTADLTATATGINDITFVFYGEDYEFDYWRFE